MIDLNKPITNSNLIMVINDMKDTNSQKSQDKVIDEVMKAHFIAPVTITPIPVHSCEGGEVILKENTTISFHIIENTAEQKFFLVFTDWEELGKWHKSENQ